MEGNTQSIQGSMRKSWKGKRAGSGSKVRLPTGNGCLSPTAASNCAANNLDELGSRFILWNKIHILWQENLKLKNSLLFFGLPWPLCALCICIMNLAVQSLSRVRRFVTPRTAACQASLSIPDFWSSLKLIPLSRWCHPTLSSSVIPFSSCLQSVSASASFPIAGREPILTPCWNCFFDLPFCCFCCYNQPEWFASENSAPLPDCQMQVPLFRTLSSCRWQEGRH